MEDWSGRTILVTGAGQGIGRAIALAFGRRGASIAILDARAETAEECCSEVEAAGGRASAHVCDVANAEEVRTSVAAIGTANVLVNNAGMGRGGILTGTLEDWDRVLAVNLRGAYLMAREVAPLMRQAGGGSIIQIASTRALQSEPNSEPYAASKAGLLGLTHALAASLGAWGIRCNAICPGWIDTANYLPFAERHAPQNSASDAEQHWVGRVGRPEDIAEAAVYLSSESAGFITGQWLIIDGGMTRKMIYV